MSVGFVHEDVVASAHQVVVADFNADGFDDLALTIEVAAYVPPTLRVLLNDGAGGFTESASIAQGTSLNLAVADFDHDGDLDILALGFRLFRNDGSGAFAAPELLSATTVPDPDRGPRFFDADADDFPDIAYQDTTGAISIYRNMAGASLAAPVNAGTPTTMRLIAAVDMDASGRDDLVLADANGVIVYLNDAMGAFAPGPRFDATLSTEHPPILADISDDGRPDLVWALNGLHSAANIGAGAFLPIAPAPTGDAAIFSAVDVRDFNADGVLDVLALRAAPGNITEVVVSLGAGLFTYLPDAVIVTRWSTGLAGSVVPLVGDFAPDSSPDVIVRWRPSSSPFYGSIILFRASAGPTISTLIAPGDPIIPGRTLSLTQTVVGAEGRDISQVLVYHDTDANGLLDRNIDTLMGAATRPGPSSTTWTASIAIDDGFAIGAQRFFVLAIDEADIRSDAAPVDLTLWARAFYPEGWRNDATINEYVPIVNPNDFPVTYRLVAHYETGERDQVIAEGVIPALTRGGVTISEHANPAAALVRLNEGYALELQSTAFLGAMLSHYDAFGTNSIDSAATGEAFTSTSADRWYFADASTANRSFIVLFNPTDADIELTFRFYDDQQSFITLTRTIGALRRSGIDLNNPSLGLPPGVGHAVEILATGNVVAALSTYSLTADSGYSLLGTPLPNGLGTSDFAPIELREGTSSRLVLFNLSRSLTSTATVLFTYADAGGASITRSFILAPLQRRVVDLALNAPPGASDVAIHVAGPGIAALVDTSNPARGDSTAASAATQPSRTWAFADGFLDRDTAGSIGFESLALFNPAGSTATVTIRFLFSDGAIIERAATLGSLDTFRMSIDEDQEITGHSQLNFFSIMVYSDVPIVASMTHWDLFQGGGWSTLGTPSTLHTLA